MLTSLSIYNSKCCSSPLGSVEVAGAHSTLLCALMGGKVPNFEDTSCNL